MLAAEDTTWGVDALECLHAVVAQQAELLGLEATFASSRGGRLATVWLEATDLPEGDGVFDLEMDFSSTASPVGPLGLTARVEAVLAGLSADLEAIPASLPVSGEEAERRQSLHD
ncbi:MULTISPECIES: hypothetical protein [Cryobacterium]|uniref:Uncharacterized protein n=1 Tax=Cryobacterium glucosi TaxID=1259175 RepID=A0ABY2IQR8_9MICO|nr:MULTISPECIES: hypothetical protein [Cryobacterium]TFB99715.1 hypothetical protein E3O39_02945 [Cryobacterium sp. MDB2-A-1]TFC09698.1 hypothetical protein E3O35_14135 [Cryobacterium sp. MDB2-A-2]TFC22676.1 hypothetical protein E3O46_04365 [Cryobacterium glucosi]TFC23970.1 hypothetical protein E3O51_00150 [Cryobacterium sp. MDB2-10]